MIELAERLSAAADPPQRPNEADVPDRVGKLRPPPGLQKRQQVEFTAVIGSVT
jgi:hypothetical protein